MMFLTATLAEQENDPHVISDCWRHFVKLLRESYGKRVKIVRVLQVHPGGHGWHVHAVCDQYIPASFILRYASAAGLGRMDFRMISGDSRQRVCDYLARYISRDLRKRCKLAKGVRLVTASGSLGCAVRWWVRLSDMTIEQDSGRLMKSLRMCCETMGMVLAPYVSPLSLFTGAPPAALAKWRSLNPGFAY
jgi:hypothetical protein